MNNTNDLTINTEKVLLNFCRNLRIIYIDELLFIEMYTEYMLSYIKTFLDDKFRVTRNL